MKGIAGRPGWVKVFPAGQKFSRLGKRPLGPAGLKLAPGQLGAVPEDARKPEKNPCPSRRFRFIRSTRVASKVPARF